MNTTVPAAGSVAADIDALLDALLGPGDPAGPQAEPADPAVAAALAARMAPPADAATGLAAGSGAGSGVPLAMLAAQLDGGLTPAEREALVAQLAASVPARLDADAAIALIDAIAAVAEPAPADLLAAALMAARGGGAAGGDIIALRRRPAAPLPVRETFLLLAAASVPDSQAVLCRSQSGLWTLEIFVATEPQARAAGTAELLLTVHPDHRATYEGRRARVFVTLAAEERVLAEAAVREGEVFAPISVAGLDLFTRDAISVTFGPAPEPE